MLHKKGLGLHGESEGFYVLERIKTDRMGRAIEQSAVKVAEFPNLLTDSGLLEVRLSSIIQLRCYVGAGTTPPSFGDTSLQALIGAVGGLATATTTNQTSTMPYYSRSIYTWTSGTGAVAGNISEVACGWGPTNLLSRALILDALGNPTTIVVLPDEQLRVTYEHRYYIPTEDVTGTFELTGNLGGVYSFIGRAASITIDPNSSTSWNGTRAQQLSTNMSYVTYHTGGIGGITSQPSGTASGTGNNPPVSGSGQSSTLTVSSSTGQNNILIRSARVLLGRGCYQFEFDPPINKTNLDTLSMTFGHSWGRR